GTAGLAGIRPGTSGGLGRPLIEVGRAGIETPLRERGIGWRGGSGKTNLEVARHPTPRGLVPEMIWGWDPSLVGNLSQTARWAQDEEAYWETEINKLAALLLKTQPDQVLVNSTDLCSLPRAVARRLIRRAIEHAKGDLRGVSFQHVERIVEMAEAP